MRRRRRHCRLEERSLAHSRRRCLRSALTLDVRNAENNYVTRQDCFLRVIYQWSEERKSARKRVGDSPFVHFYTVYWMFLAVKSTLMDRNKNWSIERVSNWDSVLAHHMHISVETESWFGIRWFESRITFLMIMIRWFESLGNHLANQWFDDSNHLPLFWWFVCDSTHEKRIRSQH